MDLTQSLIVDSHYKFSCWSYVEHLNNVDNSLRQKFLLIGIILPFRLVEYMIYEMKFGPENFP